MHPILSNITKELCSIYSEKESLSIAKIVLTDALGIDLLSLMTDKDIKLSDSQTKILLEIVERLKNDEPLQYVLGISTFAGLQFKIGPGVLIPRQETEELVSLIIRENKNNSSLKIVDIGTGSGCIAISLSHHLPNAEVEAWDISEDAIDQAISNNERLHTDVTFHKKDVLGLTIGDVKEESFSLVVSNPPYITNKEKINMDANVLDWEPSLALFVPDDDPMLFYSHIGLLAYKMLQHQGLLYFEINQEYGKEVKDTLQYLKYKDIEIIKDVFGRDRFVKAKK